jgi:hypothetical protein
MSHKIYFPDSRAHEIFGEYPHDVLNRFRTFLDKNPEVMAEFKRLATRMRNAGRKKYSADMIKNIIRWERDLKTNGDPFKINNDFGPLMARLLVYQDPSFNGFFEFRQVRSKGRKSDEQLEREGRNGPMS